MADGQAHLFKNDNSKSTRRDKNFLQNGLKMKKLFAV
jgi:hypothetical protein